MHRIRRLIVPAALALAAALGAAGCFNPFNPLVSAQRVASAPAPAPNSPANVVKLFAWCWLNRDPSLYAEIFTDDYRFIFAPNDSAGNPYRDSPWIREYELSSAQHMFVGGADKPPASEIQITIDNLLVALSDPRPGKNPTYHRSIRTHVLLNITVDQNGAPDVSTVQGYALFYLVRGDSAVIPSELRAQGFRSDSTRWWIERWEDETAGANAPQGSLRPALPFLRRPAPPTPSLPIGPVTFGQVKRAYF